MGKEPERKTTARKTNQDTAGGPEAGSNNTTEEGPFLGLWALREMPSWGPWSEQYGFPFTPSPWISRSPLDIWALPWAWAIWRLLCKGISFEGSNDFPLKLQMALWSCYKSNSCNSFLVKQTQVLLTKHWLSNYFLDTWHNGRLCCPLSVYPGERILSFFVCKWQGKSQWP